MNDRPSFLNPPFPEKLLFEHEMVVVDLKPHWWFFARSAGAVLLTGLAVIWAATWDGSNAFETWGGLLLVAMLVLALCWLGLRWMKWRSTHFVLTSERVVFRSGILAKRGVAIPLERIDNINFHQTLFQRMIGAGDLQMESAGQDGQQFFFNIRRPNDVQSLIHVQIEENEHDNDAGGTVDVASRLERLEGLRDRGTLTEEEFQREKRRLLDSL